MGDNASRSWRLSGRVQGVGFRWFVRQRAIACGVNGDVRNRPDGSVEVRAQGTPEQLDRLQERLRVGPPGARVEQLERLESDADIDFDGFEIRS